MNFPKQSMKTFAFVLFAFLTGVLPSRELNANPTSKNPHRGLTAHGTIPEAKGLTESLYQLFSREQASVISMFDRRDNPASFSNSAISQTAGATFAGRRQALLLGLMGEPASRDLLHKMNQLSKENSRSAQLYGHTARGSKHRAKLLQQLNRERPAVSRFLDQVAQQIQRGQLEGAEKQLEAKGRDLWGKLIFFTPSVRKKYLAQFERVLGNCDSQLTAKRKAAYQQQARTVIVKHLAEARKFGGQVANVVSQIGVAPVKAAAPSTVTPEAPTVPTEGEVSSETPTETPSETPTEASTEPEVETAKPLSAPEAFAQVAELWGKASASLIRANAIEWAFTGKTESKLQPTASQLMEQASIALVTIVDTAANTTPPEEAAKIYSELLKQISVVDRRQHGKTVSKACEGAMAKLAARQPGLPELILAYEKVTAQPLSWRERFTEQQGAVLRKDVPKTQSLMAKKSIAKQHIRPNYAMFQPRESVVASPFFGLHADWQLYETAARMIRRKVVEEDIIRISPTSRTAVVPFRSNHYCNLPVSLSDPAKLGDLKTALMVDETNGPLSIAAADAISSAELNDYDAVGGTIEVVHLESPITRFIALPDAAYVLTRLGNVPFEGEARNPMDIACWRFDVQPIWAQHKYYTITPTRE